MTRLADLATPRVPGRPLLVVPVGATEQHGPHLPLSTDLVIAEAVAAAVAERFGAVLAAGLPVGASGEHQGFAGTLSIGSDALVVVLVELVRSAAPWADGVALVNGHGGNAQAVAAATSQLRREGHRVAAAHCGVPGGDAHAGRTETSLLLHLRPDLVGPERPTGDVRPLREILPALRSDGVAALSPSGVLGDARGASAAEGAALLAQIVEAVVARVREQLEP